MFKTKTFAIALTTGLLLTSACKKDEAAPAAVAQTSATPLPSSLFVNEAPPNARAVGELKADAQATGEVVVFGRIGGRAEPFVDGMAAFILADRSMKQCNELHGDTCKKPWDYCCEPRESLAAKTATIQIVDAHGTPLRTAAQGQHGLTPMAEVTIAGTILPRPDTSVLVINASKIYVKKAG